MTYSVTEIMQFDSKRNKVILDNGEVTFLLYKAECRELGLQPPGQDRRGGPADTGRRTELTEAEYRAVMEEILLPRAKKRVLYYLRNGDRTREQIRRKLREGGYPEEVIGGTMAFLDQYDIADDDRYTESFIEELKGSGSRREIEMKLSRRGIRGSGLRQRILAAVSDEDEAEACRKALIRKCGSPRELSGEEKAKAYAHLARKGFGPDTIGHAFRLYGESAE